MHVIGKVTILAAFIVINFRVFTQPLHVTDTGKPNVRTL
jgi:hypothetical protein